jgi:hypothetical protein
VAWGLSEGEYSRLIPEAASATSPKPAPEPDRSSVVQMISQGANYERTPTTIFDDQMNPRPAGVEVTIRRLI